MPIPATFAERNGRRTKTNKHKRNQSSDSESRLSDEQEPFMNARKVELVTVAHVPDCEIFICSSSRKIMLKKNEPSM
eukprot:gene23584-biopygen8722